MRTFILKVRKGRMPTHSLTSQLGSPDHFEVVLHTIMNAFFVASDFRQDVELYLVFDSRADFPLTVKLSAAQGLSLPGFHEQALLSFLQASLGSAIAVEKNQHRILTSGVEVYGFGLERLVQMLLDEKRSVFLLDPKGQTTAQQSEVCDPVFILSDHLMMPKKSVLGLKRRGVKTLSLGQKMLFASQCVVILHHAWDQFE